MPSMLKHSSAPEPQRAADPEKNVSNAWRGLKYPDSDVVGLIARSVPLRSGLAIDMGCGSGRHTRLLDDFGFDAIGVESDPVTCEIALSNGVSAVCGSFEDYRPTERPALILAWGLAPLGNIVDFEEKIAALQADYVICDWRTRNNSFAAYPDNQQHADGTLTVHREGHVLDGLHYRLRDEADCVLPGYERLLIRTITKREGDEVNEWYQTSFRRLTS